MIQLRRNILTLGLLLLVAARTNAATNAQLSALGVLSVKAKGAKGDGVTDDTAAIQSAIDEAKRDAKAVLFPEGTYLVSNTLKCYKPDPDSPKKARYYVHNLIGSTAGARPTIKLKDNSTGFNRTIGAVSSFSEASKVKPVIIFACFLDEDGDRQWDFNDTSGNGVWDPGEGTEDTNVANGESDGASTLFNQGIRNLNIDLGSGNSSAAGLRFLGSQFCYIEDVSIKASGAFCGLYNMIGQNGSFGNIQIEGGRCGVYGEGKYPSIVGVSLTNQTEYAVYGRGGPPLLITGFHIQKSAPPAIYLDNTGSLAAGDCTLVDGIIEFASASSTAAIDNTKNNSVAIHNVFTRNATNLVKNSSTNVAGGSGWKRVAAYAHGEGTTGKILVNGSYQTTDIRSVFDAVEGDVPDDLVSRHLWNPADYPSADHVLDRIAAGDSSIVIGTSHGMQADDTDLESLESIGFDNTPALQALLDNPTIRTILIPKGKYLFKKSSAGNYGIQIPANKVLMGLSTSLTELRTHDDWNPTAEVPLVTTVNDANADPKMAFLKLGFTIEPLANDWFATFDWRAGKYSMTRNIYPRGIWANRASTQARADMIFSGNAGGRHYAIGGGPAYAHDALPYAPGGTGNYRRIRITNTTQPLHFYNLNVEDGQDKYQGEAVNCQNVVIYGIKSEDPNGFEFRNSTNCALLNYGGRAEVEVDNCNDILIGLVGPKSDFGSTMFTEIRGAVTTTLKHGNVMAHFARGNFDWAKTEIRPESETSVKEMRYSE